MMLQRDNPDAAGLNFEAWRASFRSISGLYALEYVACSEIRIDRTSRNIRGDGMDLYGALFQVAGTSFVATNDRIVQLAAGDVLLVDGARPVSYIADGERTHWLCLQLPRRPLVTNLGFEPQGGSHKHGGTPAARLLYECARHALDSGQAPLSPADAYMQLAVYDLVGALFVPDPWSGPHSTDKLFERICGIIRDCLAAPELGPQQIAADAGISLRYVHKLFAERGLSCRDFIYSLRLEHAARLLKRRSGKARPLSEIAYACGFRDYTHFARKFRHRFGHSPGAHPAAPVQAHRGSL